MKLESIIDLDSDSTPYFYDGEIWYSNYMDNISVCTLDNGDLLKKPYFFSSDTKKIKGFFYRIQSRG